MKETDAELNDSSGYMKKTQKYQKAHDSHKTFIRLIHFTWDDIEAEVEQTVDTVIMDCEGCWVDLVDMYIDRFRTQVNTIVIGKIHRCIDNLYHSKMNKRSYFVCL